MWWKILIAACLYFALGLGLTARMFDYPVGSFWHIMAALFWPGTLFFH